MLSDDAIATCVASGRLQKIRFLRVSSLAEFSNPPSPVLGPEHEQCLQDEQEAILKTENKLKKVTKQIYFLWFFLLSRVRVVWRIMKLQ